MERKQRLARNKHQSRFSGKQRLYTEGEENLHNMLSFPQADGPGTWNNLILSLLRRADSYLGLSPRKLHPLLQEKDPKNDSPKNYSFWIFEAHMPYNCTQFAAFTHPLFIENNYCFV